MPMRVIRDVAGEALGHGGMLLQRPATPPSRSARATLPAMSAFVEKYGPWGVVAGASEGLGAAFAWELAARGLRLVLLARRAQVLEEIAASIRQRHGVEVRAAAVDLGEADVLARVRGATEGLDVGLLVYNAAYSEIGAFLDWDIAGKLKTLDVNCRAPLLLSDHFGRTMVARGRGASS